MSNQKKTNQPSIASFFAKKDSSIIKTPKKEVELPSIRIENKEPLQSPSSDSDDKSLSFVPTKRAKKRVLSFDESDQDQKSNSSIENIKETPTKIVKQMKIIDTKDENNKIITQIEQTTTIPIEQPTTITIEQKNVADPQSYNPGKTNYDPINDACWKLGDK
ncbi:unnamed protein product [Rotaria sp. Silwood1]|nr:unnamed protein product [Rotaria sp. Silwood1]